MRQLTIISQSAHFKQISKLPMRQLTGSLRIQSKALLSKLPMRQLTQIPTAFYIVHLSKLPMRQLTMLERKKKPTARALIHLFPTLTQIYSCFEID